jgi:hypoxanthine phosphoribosyltransferase
MFPETFIIDEYVFAPFISEKEIDSIVKDLANRINIDYVGKEPLFIITLKGALFFAVDLLRHITLNSTIETIRAKSYGSKMKSGGIVELSFDNFEVAGKDIIIIEDIIDTGFTIKELINKLQEKYPASIKVVSLLSKTEMRKVDIDIKYLGKEIPSVFVIGYGLDYDERGRNLPLIYSIQK